MDHETGKAAAGLEPRRGFPRATPWLETGQGTWAVPWSDLMMVMFVLFLVLYVTQQSKAEVGARYQAEAPATRIEEAAFVTRDPLIQDPTGPVDLGGSIYRESVRAAEESGYAQVAVVLRPDRSVQVDLGGKLFFSPGSADLGEHAADLLDRLARMLAENEQAVQVVGHTDDRPIETERYPSNWELSSARASAVARHLIEHGSLDPGRFRVVGRGMYAPADSNQDPDGKARNRRVEIVIEAPGEAP